MQDLAAERGFYEELFQLNPDNEHITEGYEELYEMGFDEDPDGFVLDLGCGTGAHAVRLARRGFDVIAVDLTRSGVRRARQRFVREGLNGAFVVANAEALPFRDGFASVTWTSLLLHHFPNPTDLIREIARITRDRLIAFEPNAANLLTWFAMNVVNRFWGISAMTPNQIALGARRLEKRLRREGFERRRLHYVGRDWDDRLRIVRRLYAWVLAPLPRRFRANKFLIVVEKKKR